MQSTFRGMMSSEVVPSANGSAILAFREVAASDPPSTNCDSMISGVPQPYRIRVGENLQTLDAKRALQQGLFIGFKQKVSNVSQSLPSTDTLHCSSLHLEFGCPDFLFAHSCP